MDQDSTGKNKHQYGARAFKLQSQGQSTLTISVPYKFAQHNNLKKGDRLVATWVGNTLEYHILKSTEPVEIEPVEVSILHQPVG